MTDPRSPQPRFRLSDAVIQARFLSILPMIRSVAEYIFRDRPPRFQEDYIQETISYAWAAFVRLARRGKDARQFARTFAELNAKAVRNGRRVAGGYNKYDLTTAPPDRSGMRIESLHRMSAAEQKPWDAALTDGKDYTPADAAAFRIDFAAWRKSLSRRNRKIADALATGERTSAVARKFKLTPGRISQLRREFHDSWQTFTQDDFDPEDGPELAAA